MTLDNISTAFTGVSSRPPTPVRGIRAARGDVSFTLAITGAVEHKNSDPRSVCDAEKCAGRVSSGLAWARLYLVNEGYAVETIYER